MSRRAHLLRLAVLVNMLLFVDARAAINFSIQFDDPSGIFDSVAEPLEFNLQAAADRWSQLLQGDASLEIVVRPNDNLPRATGYSLTTYFVGNNGTFEVFEQAAGTEIRTGMDPNGTDPDDFNTYDIAIESNTDYLFNNMWFDPDPYARTAPVPENRTDAVSVFLHELAHAIGFNGWIDRTTGEFPDPHPGFPPYQSTLDELTTFDGTDFNFTGSQASALYGGPVPLTFGNPFHFGNAAPGPGSDLTPDMMNGIVYYYGTRYDISALDLALLRDINIPATVPADFDRDGDVDEDDYAVWYGAFGSQTLLAADGNDNGVVDAADYTVWRDNLGTNIPGRGSGSASKLSQPTTSGVPEPRNSILAVIGGLLLIGGLGRPMR